MRAVIQRVSTASVATDEGLLGAIGAGLLVLVSVAADDTTTDGAWLAEKVVKLRIFPGEGTAAAAGASMARAVTDVRGEILVISQFTLHASVRKGTRPSFNAAARPEVAVPLYEDFVARLQQALGRPVQTGRFGALMKVSLVNDGPVTIIIDTRWRE